MRTFAECDPVGHTPEGTPTYRMPLGVRAHRIDQSVIDAEIQKVRGGGAVELKQHNANWF